MARKFGFGGRRSAPFCDGRRNESETETARKVIEKFGTNDVFVIAEKADVKIVYENWHPVTIGEFEKKRKRFASIFAPWKIINYAERKIIAHELGHFFAAEFNFDRKTEEIFAREFAEN